MLRAIYTRYPFPYPPSGIFKPTQQLGAAVPFQKGSRIFANCFSVSLEGSKHFLRRRERSGHFLGEGTVRVLPCVWEEVVLGALVRTGRRLRARSMPAHSSVWSSLWRSPLATAREKKSLSESSHECAVRKPQQLFRRKTTKQ